jgi:hypothetical protein
MADSVQLPNEQETHVRFVIVSVAKQSSALFGQSGLLRRSAPRNDGNMLLTSPRSKGALQ